MTIGDRLRAERERLGLSQTALAAHAGTSKQVQISYEKGKTFPNAEYLAIFAELGADINFVVTGKQFLTPSPQPPVATVLTPREEALIDNYRHTAEAGKRAIEATGAVLAREISARRKAGGER